MSKPTRRPGAASPRRGGSPRPSGKTTGKRSNARRRRSRWLILVTVFVAAVGLAGWWLLKTESGGERNPPKAKGAASSPETRRSSRSPAPAARKPRTSGTTKPQREAPSSSTSPALPSPEPSRGAKPVIDPEPALEAPRANLPSLGRIAVVIDDLGRSLQDLERIERLAAPVTYAVLPYESKTAEVAAAVRARGGELVCHLPMEPENGKNPGPGALHADMSEAELAEATRRAVAAVPGAVGVNNHMGSRMSADADAMRAILEVLVGQKLFFLDSRTSADSVAFRTARTLGLAAAERQVFLDTDANPDAIREQFERLLRLARERGQAIAIGHPYRETLDVLEAEIQKARREGFEFVPVSQLLEDAGGLPD